MKDNEFKLDDIEAPHTLGEHHTYYLDTSVAGPGVEMMMMIYCQTQKKKGTLDSPHLQRNWPQLG